MLDSLAASHIRSRMNLGSRRVLGITLVAVGSILWSTAGLFVRAIHVDLWTTMVWRSLFGALSLALVLVVLNGRNSLRIVKAIGLPGLIAVPISATSMLCYVAALRLTSVANVMMVYATIPFVAAAIAFLVMRERPKRHVLFASALAFTGVLVIVGSGTRFDDLAGNAVALLMTVTFGIVLVMARRYPSIDMAPVNGLAASICALACWPLSPGIWPDPFELVMLGLFGTITTGLAYLLVLTGGRYIPSSEAGLIGFLDVILGPLWVWLAFGERPARAAFIGGCFVFAAVVWYLFREMREPNVDPIECGARQQPLEVSTS